MRKKEILVIQNEFNKLTFDHLVTRLSFPLQYPYIYKSIKNDYDILSDLKSNKNKYLQEELISQIQGILIGASSESTKKVLSFIKDNAKNKVKLLKALEKGENNVR